MKYYKLLNQKEPKEITREQVDRLPDFEVFMIRYPTSRIVETYPHPNGTSVITVQGVDQLTTRAMETKIKEFLQITK